jgi:deoxyribodipyrimidine photo-lyase
MPTPARIPAPTTWPASLTLEQLELEPKIDWTAGIRATWTPGNAGAEHRLQHFLDDALADYHQTRDRPASAGSSRLSPHVHFGEISVRRVWHVVQSWRGPKKDRERFLAELGWREFAHHLLYHFPQSTDEPLRPEFSQFPWQRDETHLRAWRKGQTGYPIVDAGMRELWTTGWMHNRVRMIVASFLVKDLLLSWQEGARWFWDTLVDADLANNTLGWQWSAGCGADAAPYFRVFNPVLQGERFDPAGEYVRRWIPELTDLPDGVVHKPWKAQATLDYPRPIVDHAAARRRALAAYAEVKSNQAARGK